LLNRILHPQEKSREWLKHFRDQTIKMTNLWEEVPTFSKDANPMEVAQSLAYHYAVLIDDKDGNYGLITRNDLVKVLRNSFPLT
jgi:predicted transcriptional regulator